MSSSVERLLWLCATFTLVIANSSLPDASQQQASVNTPSCDGLKTKSRIHNFSIDNNLNGSDGARLTICVNNNGSKCCSRQTEKYLHKLSVQNLQTLRTAKTDLITKVFNDGRTKFDDFFQNVISESEKKLDLYFNKIYKAAYTNNTHITRAFYANLRKYYSKGKSTSEDIIKAFFQEILKKLYVFFHGPVKNLDCIGKTLDAVEPFGETPRKLTSQVQRSFTAARTFVKGMTFGKFVVDKLTSHELSKECLSLVTRMTQCSLCTGHNHNLKPCAAYCISIFSECFGFLVELKDVWDIYLKQMQKLATKLVESYDIDAVTSDMVFDISTGITHFQSNNDKLPDQIKKLCPQAKRNTRSLTSSDTSDFFLENERTKRASEPTRHDKSAQKSPLARLTNQYRDHFDKLKQFWSRLPKTLCDETVVAVNGTDKQCWNGVTLVDNNELAQKYESGRRIVNGKNRVGMKLLLNELEVITRQLKDAAAGKDVREDGDISYEELSGSGSGSGSGSSGGGDFEESTTPYDEGQTTPCANCVDREDDNPNVLGIDNNAASSYCISSLILVTTALFHLML